MRSLAFTLLLLPMALLGQLGHSKAQFTHQDSLRGSIGPDRAWWDVVGYDVWVRPDFDTRSISGRVQIAFNAVTAGQRMQIDLQQPMIVDSVVTDVADFKDGAISVSDKAVPFVREENVALVELPQAMKPGEATTITVYYHGIPRGAKSPPWDGGWIWRKDAQGNPWMSVACQGLGASVWYPCKDHQIDEPDNGANLHITVPDSLQAIGNGRLRGTTRNADGTTTWYWQVKSPINTYNLVPYIGKYAHWSEQYAGVDGALDCDYWVLENRPRPLSEGSSREADEKSARDLEMKKRQFKQVPTMIRCFEEWFGPYPFYADGYKLVEAPHLGMEHQSAIAYGNRFQNGYLGNDLSGTGHGQQWDYIIVHESGHEWFGNSITTADIADMWIHEGFTDYSETIFTECQQGKEAAEEYLIGLRKNIRNDRPVIGPYGVNEEGSGDMYYKGANIIHMVRHIVGDSTFKAMLLEMNRRFFHTVVTSAEIEDFMIHFDERTKRLLDQSLFDQYLRTTKVPVLEWGVFKGELWCRWSNCIEGFRMPVGFTRAGAAIPPVSTSTTWTRIGIGMRPADIAVDRNWYVIPKALAKSSIKKALRGKRDI